MKVLIIKFGALGDVVMATALIERIQTHHRDSDCTLLTSLAFGDLFANWPALRVNAVPRHGMRAFMRTATWMRSESFGRLYDLQSSERSGWLCALSGVRERIGNHPRFPYTHHPAVTYRGQNHIFERMNEVLACAGIAPAQPSPRLPISEAECAQVDAWLATHKLHGKHIVLLHAGASAQRPEKRWPFFDVLAKQLAASDCEIVWVGASADRVLNQKLAAGIGIDATDTFNIAQLAQLGRRARFAITNDSGPMHILSCSGIPVYALFGPSDWRRNHAIGQAARVIAAPTLREISASTVIERLQADGALA